MFISTVLMCKGNAAFLCETLVLYVLLVAVLGHVYLLISREQLSYNRVLHNSNGFLQILMYFFARFTQGYAIPCSNMRDIHALHSYVNFQVKWEMYLQE